MGRRRGRWRRAGKGQEWEGKGEAGGWTRRSGVVRGRQDWDNGEETGRGNGEVKMERGQHEGGDGEGGNGKGVTGEGQKGGGEEGARGGGILQMDMI